MYIHIKCITLYKKTTHKYCDGTHPCRCVQNSSDHQSLYSTSEIQASGKNHTVIIC